MQQVEMRNGCIERNEVTVKQLKELHAGQRRRFHDDMSVVVINLHSV